MLILIIFLLFANFIITNLRISLGLIFLANDRHSFSLRVMFFITFIRTPSIAILLALNTTSFNYSLYVCFQVVFLIDKILIIIQCLLIQLFIMLLVTFIFVLGSCSNYLRLFLISFHFILGTIIYTIKIIVQLDTSSIVIFLPLINHDVSAPPNTVKRV